MELTKAIELSDDLRRIPDTQLDPDYLDAIKLGIEALKTIQKMRQDNAFLSPRPLLGETLPNLETKPTKLFYPSNQ